MKYAFVNILYDCTNIASTLVLIKSIINTKSKIDKVLLCVDDVPPYKLDLLKPYYDKIHYIEYFPFLEQTSLIFNLFTLHQYKKVLYLDNNTLVLKNIDDIFEKYYCPAAMAISPSFRYKKKQVTNKNVMFDLSILMIRPSKSKYILGQLIAKCKEYNSIQEFLSQYFSGRWTNISYLYNFQPDLTFLNDKRGVEYRKTDLSKIKIMNYGNMYPLSIVNKIKKNDKEEYYKLKKYIDPWISEFIQIGTELNEKGINIFNIKGIIKDINKYFKEKYDPIIKKLNDQQQKELLEKLNKGIPKSTESNKEYKYSDIVNLLIEDGNQLFIQGGVARKLVKGKSLDESDIDFVYTMDPDIVEEKLKTLPGLKYKRTHTCMNYFMIGEKGLNEVELIGVDFIDKIKNASMGTLLVHLNDMSFIDYTKEALNAIEQDIWKKIGYKSYEEWHVYTRGGLLCRMIKFAYEGYKIDREDKISIYRDWYDNRYYFDWKKVEKCLETFGNVEEKLEFMKNDIDNLNIEFTGQQFIDQMKKFIFKNGNNRNGNNRNGNNRNGNNRNENNRNENNRNENNRNENNRNENNRNENNRNENNRNGNGNGNGNN